MEKRTAVSPMIATKDMVLTGMFAALLAAISQISIPMPSGVPITLQIFGVALTGTVLGWKRALMTVLIYILLGAAGLPVFSGFRGGMSVLLGYAGGYVLAWPVFAVFCGISLPSKKFRPGLRTGISILFALLGLMIDEAAGALQWAFLAGDQSFPMIMIYSFGAFIPKDMILTVLAVLAGSKIRKSLILSGHLS